MRERFERLITTLNAPEALATAPGVDVIEATVPVVSTAAVLYEKVRATIDYQEEHLLRRNAILRFLKRNLGSDQQLDHLATHLLKELVWARYLPNKAVPTLFVHELTPVFSKYEPLLTAADGMGGDRESTINWILDVMSTELEYRIVPHINDEALVSYMYEEMRPRIAWDEHLRIDEADKDLLLFTAIHKTLLKSNMATLRYRMLILYYPDWAGASTSERIAEIAGNLKTVIGTIEGRLHSPVTEKLAILVRRKCGIFRVLFDVAQEHGKSMQELLEDPEALDKAVEKALRERSSQFKKRLRRTVIRAIMFLFITKMALALIIEVPYDLLVEGALSYMPLAVNIFFHPFLLFLIGITVTVPDKNNADDYRDAIRALMVGADSSLINIRVKPESSGVLHDTFSFIYGLVFVAVYSLIGYGLSTADFNWLSITLFLFFISLVTFFGIRIRLSTKDIVASETRSGIIGSLFDILMLPVVRMGRWLSTKVAKINIFIYFFDFIIESPFKVAIRIIESWFAFLREKKEEL